MPGHFDDNADDWIAWTRTPGVDVYGTVSRPGFWPLLPTPGGLTLEVGCGEGRVSRDLARDGHRVVGVDLSERLLAAARAADPAGDFVLGDAARLPIRDGCADLVVCFNVLMDVDDLAGACQEIGRVLRRGGRACLCIPHPFTEAIDHVDGPGGERQTVLTRTYLGSHPFDAVADRNDVRMRFRGWSHSLAVYFEAFAGAGLAVERLYEVAAGPEAVAAVPTMIDVAGMPMFLAMRLAHRIGN